MVDIASISAAVTGLKAATDIAKGFAEFKNITEVQGGVIELQTVILAAQASAMAAQSDQYGLLEKIRELEEIMAQMEAWDAEKGRYILTDYGGQTFAYELKEGEANGEPQHRICANCFTQSQKSILQFRRLTATHRDKYFCPSCEVDYDFGVAVNRQRRIIR